MSDYYTRNSVYNYVYSKVIAQYPDAYIASVYEPIVPRFPCVFIREVGNASNPPNVTLSGAQNVWVSTFEVQVQSNKTDMPMSEAYGIYEVVKSAFTSLFYVLQSVNVLEEGDNGIFRLVAQFRKINGIADKMPSE